MRKYRYPYTGCNTGIHTKDVQSHVHHHAHLHKDIRAEQLQLLLIEKKKTLREARDFAFFNLLVGLSRPKGIRPFVGDGSMRAASLHERGAGHIVYRYTFCSMKLSSNILTPPPPRCTLLSKA